MFGIRIKARSFANGNNCEPGTLPVDYPTMPSSSYLHDRAAVRSVAGTLQVPRTAARGVAEICLLSLRLRVFQGASLGDFFLAPVCPIEKVTLWVGFFYLTS